MKFSMLYKILSLLIFIFFMVQVVAGIGSGYLVSKTKDLLKNENELFKDEMTYIGTSVKGTDLIANLKIRESGEDWEENDIVATVGTKLEFKTVISSNKESGHLYVIVMIDLPLINGKPMFDYVEGSASNPLNFIDGDDKQVAWYYTIITKTNSREMSFKAIIKEVGTKSVNVTAYSLEPDTDSASDSVQIIGKEKGKGKNCVFTRIEIQLERLIKAIRATRIFLLSITT